MGEFFWLLCGLWVGVGNAVFVWFDLRKPHALGSFSPAEARRLVAGIALWILVPCLLFWVLQLSVAGEATPFPWAWPAPQKQLAFGLQIFLWVALLLWVFVGRGAVTVSRYLIAAERGPTFVRSPGAIRVLAVVIVVAGLTSMLSQHA